MLGRPLTPMSVAGVRRRGRRRGLLVGAAVGASMANRNSGAQDEQPVEQAAPAAPSGNDQMAELEKLGQLHQEGILTDEEFAAKKKQILGL